ncbi:swr1-complex protein 4 [Ophiostoma piceae UAMH 11346]|uniref:SWR1-complex protein 4 n=1 Tax=Ophiostoma piceae (strain UAMH 11346) TaxID=1262450 RepID=S3CTK8_OPHP1|nr:swr1-complex protein 4 [Ophiostoma piceae UAMH 11346]
MSALDARDVLNLSQDGVSGAASRPSKKQKTAGHGLGAGASRNLKGLAREVQSLGGESSIAIVPQLMSNIKKRRLANRKPAARWETRPFTNSAREDGTLVLNHWRRKTTTGPATVGETPNVGDAPADGAETHSAPDADQQPMEDSAFAKFNVKVVVPQYSDDQYDANLQHPDWTKEETDYLLELVKDFDLRWPLIWDRYDYRDSNSTGADDADSDDKALVSSRRGTESSSTRTMEDLKVRYYEIAAKMMAVQKPSQYMTQTEYNLHGIMANFNPEKEKQRKAFANNALMRSREEVREEEALLFEVRRIMDRTDKTNEERRELYHRLEFPHSDQDISAFKTSAGLQTLLQSLAYNNEKNKKRKSLANGEVSSPVPGGAGPSGASGAASADAGGNRRDSIAAVGASAHNSRRESVSQHADKASAAAAAAASAAAAAEATAPATPVSATPTSASGKNNKKGAAQTERRKLTEQEQDVYGVTYHDRLGSGPTFRYEKINKLFTHKSGQQQLRITNILNELEMPNRLFMPTSAVTTQFEVLVNGVVQLVDLRKVSDKLDSEIKIEEQRKAERERLKAIASGQTDGTANGDKDESIKEGDAREKDDERAKDSKDSKKKVTVTDEAVPTKEGDGDTGHDTRTRSGSRPGSSNSNAVAASSAHKRSASVLSVASDKSSKRQKK